MSPVGALNFKMLAELKGGVAGGLTQVATLGSGKGGIPFAIEGTTSNPHFIPGSRAVPVDLELRSSRAIPALRSLLASRAVLAAP